MPLRRKFVFVLVDGLADVGLTELSYKTPLQAANTPTFDKIASCGVNGLLDPVEPGLSCGSDTAHLSIFGYEPHTHYRGRGSFESMGAGIDMEAGDIAFKSNFATLDVPTNTVLFRRADRNFEHLGPRLCNTLDGITIPEYPEYKVKVKYATEHRCGVLLRGPRLTEKITGTDPLKDNKLLLTCEAIDSNDEDAVHTSKVVNALSKEFHKQLLVHDVNKERAKEGKNLANIILLRGAGVRIQPTPFAERYNLKPFVIAPTAIIGGLAMSLGMPRLQVPGATGDYHTNLDKKADALVENLTKDEYDFGFLHIKAVDDCGHDGNVALKVEFLEKIDKMVASILDRLHSYTDNTQFTFVITGDHSTTCCSKDHSCEPVPFAICDLKNAVTDNRAQADKVVELSEVAAGAGALGRFPGPEVMQLVLKFSKLQS
eukprot:TRINITY_DN54532_c0_g1_i1.p1 TRINITY_DN54532_c0_g1~~TRINITY_DN54532_c0_g1_i1.p1  ORF type:complete len:429 (-),score=16.91 TRINITY_DN54532_c0_g1_i1:451-1737(-)